MNVKNTIFAVVAMMLLVYVSGCSKPATSDTIKLRIVNVNDRDIYQDAHIASDINIPFEKIDHLADETKSWNKNSTIVVYCTNYSCTASKLFAKELTKLGFTDVYTYGGGAAEWYSLSKKDPSYKMEGVQQQKYLQQENEPLKDSDPGVRSITAVELLKRIQEK